MKMPPTFAKTASTLTLALVASAAFGQVVNPPTHVEPPSGALKSHPRMWVRQKDLTRLRGWAVNTNPIWKDLLYVANLRKQQMIDGKVPQLDSGDGEGNGYGYATEEIAELFAFMSLVDPDAAARADWAKRAHDLLMYAVDKAALGPAAGQPFRTPHFATFNRSRWYGQAFPLVVDWCYSTFTTAEKTKIRKVFIRWIHEILDNNIAGNGYTVSPPGLVNDPSLLTPKSMRWSSNNYWCNHARNIAMMSIALDAADDVPANTGDYYKGYLRDYIGNAIGAWMYIRKNAEGSDLRGGLSPEGPGYGESSFSGLTMMMLALHTAKYDDANTYGVGATLAKNNFWTKDVLNAYLHSLSPQTHKFYSYQPLMYLPAGYGDVLRFETFDMVQVYAPLAIMDIADGKTDSDRLNSARWIQTWTPPGGPSYMDTRLKNSINAYGTQLPILYFLMFDPNAPAPTDPRLSLSTDYVATGSNRILSRTTWGPDATWFSFISTWNVVDHQWGDANSFSLYRKGEWLTKEWSGYGKNIGAVDFQNNVAIENPPVATAPYYMIDEAKHGGQYSYLSNGDPKVNTVTTGLYVYAEGDATNRYNSTSQQATDVVHASRSIFWQKPDILVIYDRAQSKTDKRYKRFYLNFETQPSIAGKQATVTTPKGQKVYVTSLLPTTSKLTWDKPSTTWSYNESTVDEPMHYRLIGEDSVKPKKARFLTVLQGADANGSPIAANAFKSTAGSAFDGAYFGDTAVLFAVNMGQTFNGVTYQVPATVTSHYVTGLKASAAYTVTKSTAGGMLTVTITAGGSTKADKAGVIHF